MKKILLTSAALIFAAAGFAQTGGKADVTSVRELPMHMSKKSFADPNEPVIRRSAKTGTYYVPTGGLWSGFGLDGMGRGYSCYTVAPFADYTFVNMMRSPLNGKWSINGKEMEGDANGNYVGNYSPGGTFYAPELANGNDTWNFGANNVFGMRKNAAFLQGIVLTDSIWCLYPTDDHAWSLDNNGKYYSNTYSFGSLGSHFLYGSGDYNTEAMETKSYAASQAYAAFTSPLYVEQFVVDGLSTTQPIAEGDTLWAYITSVDTTISKTSGVPIYTDGEEIYETLFATHVDTLDFQSVVNYQGVTYYKGKVLFYKRTVDDFGNETIEPFVIPAGRNFTVTIKGFHKPTIDLGIQGLEMPEEDHVAVNGVVQTYDFLNDQPGYVTWYTGLTMKCAFVGMFDGVDVVENGFFNNEPADINYNVLKISDDGQTCSTYKYENTDNDLGGALVGTATYWFDEMDNSNYEVEEVSGKNDISWITNTMVSTEYYERWNGYNLVAFKAQPLGGVKGRGALLRVAGKGVESDWLYVVQGDYTPEQVYEDYLANGGENAIEGITVDGASENAAIYNLNGVRVSKDTKGMLIQNGKKFINR